MPNRQLPARPNLEHLKKQARVLLRERLASDPSATAVFASANITADDPKIADALHVIAREYGFDTWPAPKIHEEMAAGDAGEAPISAIKSNDASLARKAFPLHPSLKSRTSEPLPNYGFEAP